MTTRIPYRPQALREDGFTMIFAIIILFISSLLVTAAFVAARGDVKLTHTTTSQKKAYYAALAGIAAYKYNLSTSPYYWKKCPRIPTSEAEREKVKQSPQEEEKEKGSYQAEEYVVQTLPSEPSSSEAEHTLAKCKSGEQSPVQTKGTAVGTFRIELTGFSGGEERHLIATFKNPGFLNYVYFSKYEVEDPTNFPESERVPTEACEHYYSYRSTHSYTFNSKTKKLTEWCPPIEFAPEDEVKGPLHTDDAAEVCDRGGKEPKFGRTSSDKIEMNGGHYAASGCTNSADMVGTYTESGAELNPPETDGELLETAGKKFKGKTYIELKSGSPNTMKATYYEAGKEKSETITFPENGVVYVENAGSCPIEYTPFNTNYTGDEDCGNVYVKGTYTESLTIAAANDVVINGDIETSHESPSGKPTGSATLGLIATNFVRIYHPVEMEYQEANGFEPKHESPATRTGALHSSTTVTAVTPSASTLTAWDGGEVLGSSGIASGTTLKEPKGSTELVLSKAATKTETGVTLTFCKSGYTYNATTKLCVNTTETTKSGYKFEASEMWVRKECNLNGAKKEEKYITGSKGKCERTNTSAECDAENATGTFEPWVNAAILTTAHSFIVNNYKCGEHIGNLNLWGTIAQFWRGPVGTGGTGAGTGYTKNYNYDERMASNTPPEFLSPSTTSWKSGRVTAAPPGFVP